MTTEWTDPAHEGWEELAVGHALHSLEPEDEEAFVGHLRGCARCERVLADMSGAATELAYAAPALRPPAHLRARITAIAGTGSRLATIPGARRRARPAARWRTWGNPWMAVAAGLVVVVALGLWNFVLHQDNRAKQKDLKQATTVLQCVEDPTCQQVRLADPNTGETRGAVLVHEDGRVSVVVDNLPPNDRRSTAYVLWQGQAGGKLLPVSAFDVTCRSVCVVPIGSKLPQPRDTSTAYAVSREAQRTPPPTPAPPVAVGPVRAGDA